MTCEQIRDAFNDGQKAISDTFDGMITRFKEHPELPPLPPLLVAAPAGTGKTFMNQGIARRCRISADQ